MIKNSDQLTYVIGDVHGCFHTLKNLVSKLPTEAEIIFVGDLCDKGKYSKEVIEFVISHDYKCVKGNHEHLMQKYLYDAVIKDEHSPWSEDYRYGGIQTYESYSQDHMSMLQHLEWIRKLPVYLLKGKYFITHAYGLPFYEYRDDEAYYHKLLLHRYEEGMTVPHHDVINIFGHCVFDEVIIHERFYAIDTGCSYGNKLTAIELGSMKLVQEPMDLRDSSYHIKALKLSDFNVNRFKHDLESFIRFVDEAFHDFDIVSTEVLRFMVEVYKDEGYQEVHNMLEKNQIFARQIKQLTPH